MYKSMSDSNGSPSLADAFAAADASGIAVHGKNDLPGHEKNRTISQFTHEINYHDLVSVVIPCYNHGKYLPDAIDSVLSQKHKNVEIIVVDDGSTDCTKQMVENRYAGVEEVKYVYQNNQGLSAARNTGIDNSTGDYFVFLDADDWLVGEALRINLRVMKKDPELAYVSGGHIIINERLGDSVTRNEKVEGDYFQNLLQGNYIGMHGTVMYSGWIFDEFRFDTHLRASEDYDMYLNITRKYPVKQHTEIIAAYRFHDSNMSGDIYKMYTSTLTVLRKQHGALKNAIEKKCFNKGIGIWKKYYSAQLLLSIQHKPTWPITTLMLKEHFTAFRHHKISYLKYLKQKFFMQTVKSSKMVKKLVKKNTPVFLLKWYYNRALGRDYTPYPGRTNKGDFQRVTPFNTDFGYQRGGPVDRYYIENFLMKSSDLIHGRVLEIGDNEYTLKYGGVRVLQSDILHVDEKNPKATFIGDLSDAPQLPDNSFDCIVLTQTLHLIYDFKGAIDTCWRILRPGGTLLLTVPGISHIDNDEWGKYWMWSFTSNSVRRLLYEGFRLNKDQKNEDPDIVVNVHGNVLAATAFLYAMGVSELNRMELDYNDPQYQLIITARAVKAN
jgi:glycosyltransferase involved in cell wall biosynthesis